MATSDSSPELDALFWRDEVLQVMFWLQGEKLSEAVAAGDLEVFLNADARTIHFYLERAADDGFLVRHPDALGLWDRTRYELSERGRDEGGRRFTDEFRDMQKAGHGECGPDCEYCKDGDRSHCPSINHSH